MSFAFKSNYPQIARESGFKLRQFKDGPIDWRLVGSMEVDRILREQQFEHIDAILFHLSEAPLSSMLDSNVLDSGVAKYFILSQLALQYLIFCRKFLDESVRTLRDNNIKLETQNLHLKTINQEQTNDIVHLHKKLSQVEAIHEIVFPCHICTKNFVSNDALNVHLSKKHLKSPSIVEIQGKDNDQTLINTIKLELEIKQLKERLNIAEKDIREASEIKRVSPREIIKISSSTQTDIQTRDFSTQKELDETKKRNSANTEDIGTQCNLFEKKEFDCTENEDIRKQNTLNVQKQVDSVVNKDFEVLFEIQEKISKLEAFQETSISCNQQSINEIKFKLSEITEFLELQKKQIAENVEAKDSNLPSTSVDELQRILSNMLSEVSQINSENINKIIARIEKTYEEKLSLLKIEHDKKKTIQSNSKIDAVGSRLISVDSKKPKDESGEEKLSSVHISQRTYSVEGSSKHTSSDSQSDSYSSINTRQSEVRQLPVLKKQKVLERSKALKKLGNKMEFFGLNINSKNISAPEATRISSHLIEQRNTTKKTYPTFSTTRNRLNKLVDLLVSENSLYSDMVEKQKTQKGNEHKKLDETNAYKKRLEKILKSPIKKPTSYVSHHTHTKSEIKPVPMPRKQVMFHTENKGNL
ncbi:cilium assembly protein DZIP1L [Episyrphus balteatus]|uniref:cilium assembly protein DZIP1L n=1 Tax=Episyrphus balteatus TaxID=286459 RepID=UPI00248630F6|nr:cilium assembly protein DZIP1L [Episyrphus balteatus]XP_055854378.1 cilium assembly protein DZIP1L [Episyrphus balteatus]